MEKRPAKTKPRSLVFGNRAQVTQILNSKAKALAQPLSHCGKKLALFNVGHFDGLGALLVRPWVSRGLLGSQARELRAGPSHQLPDAQNL